MSLLVKTDGAAAATAQLTKVDAAARKAGGGMGEVEKANRRTSPAFDNVAKKSGLVALGVAGIAGAAVKTAADYESSMNTLQAVSGATGREMGKLGKLAIQLGADTKLPGTSAKDASEAMTEMIKAGVSLGDTMSGVRGTLVLSAAAGVSNARAAEIASNALNTFRLKGKDVNMVVDQLANTANSSSVEIEDVADAMKMAGAVFKAFQAPTLGAKGAMTELNTAIGLLGNAGIKGSDAGTSLKQTLLQLTGPSDKAKDAMRGVYLAAQDNAAAEGHLTDIVRGSTKERGAALEAIQKANPALKASGDIAFDASGKMRSLKDIMRLTALGTKGMTDEQKDAYLTMIFGADAVRSITTLLDAQGERWNKMEHAVQRHGAAQDLADAKMKGLKGTIEALRSTLETMAIGIGTKLLPALTSFVGTLTKILGMLSPTAWLVVIGVIGTLAATVWTVNAAIKVYEAVTKLGTAATWAWNMAQRALQATFLISPLGLVIVGIVALVAAFVIAYKKSETFRKIIDTLWNTLKSVFNWTRHNWPLLLAILTGPFGLAVLMIVKHASAIKNAVVGAFKAIVGAVKALAGSIIGLGSWTIARIVEGVRAAAGALRGAAGWIKDQIVRSMHALVASPIALGSWFVGRFVDGVKAVGDAVRKAAKWLVDKVVGAVKGFLGIGSPSKVFEDIGRNMMKGLINGMGAADVMKFVSKHLGGLVSAATGAVGNLGQSFKGSPKGGAVALGKKLAAGYGWGGGSQWNSLYSLWMGESGWDPRARNAKSGAFGIPQALPASKMGAAAVAGDAGAQIAWGLSYIKGRYGDPNRAWSAWQSRSPHWYAKGGQVDSVPAMLTPGEFVIRKSVVDKFGPTFFAALNGYKDGGSVGSYALGNLLASRYGLNISSGYRSAQRNAAVGGVPNSWHTRGTKSNPGALDLIGAVDKMRAALAWVKANVSGLAEAMIHDVGSGLHLHVAGPGLMNFKGVGGGKGTKARRSKPKIPRVRVPDWPASVQTGPMGRAGAKWDIGGIFGALLENIDDQERAGLLDPAGAALKRIGILDQAISATKDSNQRLKYQGARREQTTAFENMFKTPAEDVATATGENTDAQDRANELQEEANRLAADYAAALKDLTDQVKRQTDFATSVAATEAGAMSRWVTEVISKQMGFGISGRNQTPSYGVARRS